MNDYESRQQAKKEHYEHRAEQCARLAGIRQERARQMADIIPMGQPILVGHYSEGRDRRYRARIRGNFEKAMELQKRAEYYAQKASNVGTAGISSDDPEAVVKLQEKINKAEAVQARMTAANKAVRKNDREALKTQGFSDAMIVQLFTPDFGGRLGFASYELTNNNANIRRMKERIEQLRLEHQRRNSDGSSAMDIQTPEGVTITENHELNRLQIFFPGKPAEEVRSKLKANGFRWSPYESAWQRQLNESARYAAKRVLEAI